MVKDLKAVLILKILLQPLKSYHSSNANKIYLI